MLLGLHTPVPQQLKHQEQTTVRSSSTTHIRRDLMRQLGPHAVMPHLHQRHHSTPNHHHCSSRAATLLVPRGLMQQ